MSTKELTDKQQKQYNRILQIAYDIVLDQGFYKLSLKDLTEKIRISRSTIYDFFGSKEGLVEEIVVRYNENLNKGLLDIMNDENLSTYDRFLTISDQLAKNSPSRNIYMFYNDLKIHMPESYQYYENGRMERIEKVYKPLIEEGINNHLFDVSIPKDFLLQSYLKSSQMVCETNMMESNNLGKQEAMNLMTRIFLNGAKSI